MSRPHKFDWDEASRLHAEGATFSELAERYGVTRSGIRYAVDPVTRARNSANMDRWRRQSVCPDCGGKSTRRRTGEDRPCFKCAGARRVWTVAPDGRLRCATCKEWKAPEEFPIYDDVTTRARGGRLSNCTPCASRANAERGRRFRARKREAS